MKWFAAILLVLLVVLQQRLWFGKNSWPDYLTLKKEIALQTQSNQQLVAKNELQYQEIADLKNGLDAIEERARNELGLIKKNEQFYRLVD
ncbi:MAG: cell division protein FtsB [Psychrobium sp.]|nr:cell division protein FtsB [Psychrobium sp.]